MFYFLHFEDAPEPRDEDTGSANESIGTGNFLYMYTIYALFRQPIA